MCGVRSKENPGPTFGNPLQDLKTISNVDQNNKQEWVESVKYHEGGLTSDLFRDRITGTNYQDRLKIQDERNSKGDTRLQRSDQLGSSIGGQDSNINY